MPKLRPGALAAAVAVLAAATVAAAALALRQDDGAVAVERPQAIAAEVAPPPEPPDGNGPATAPAVPAAAGAATAPAPAPADRTAPFRGLGAWVDVFEWAPSYTGQGKTPKLLAPTAVDEMAAQGVQVLYIQASRFNNPGPTDIVDPEVLAQWIDRARAKGLRVVAWYLPTLTDPAADLRRIEAIGRLPGLDGIGIDIESTAVKDPAVRSARMLALSKAARASLPDRPLSAIVLPPVDTDVVNTGYWPDFPWQEIRPLYDVWQIMGYWTNRTIRSGYRDAARYTRENVERLRAHLGDPAAPVHPIGGIGDKTTPADVEGFLQVVRETGCIGASLYNWSTQKPDTYQLMRGARS